MSKRSKGIHARRYLRYFTSFCGRYLLVAFEIQAVAEPTISCRLASRTVYIGSYGKLRAEARFARWLILATRARLSYRRRDLPLQYWRTKNGFEVDLVLGREAAVEFKSTDDARPDHLRGLRALSEEGKIRQYILVSNDPIARTVDGIRLLHWKDYLSELEKV